ncbi:MAG: signal peptidase II [Parcubacteria group bacterium]
MKRSLKIIVLCVSVAMIAIDQSIKILIINKIPFAGVFIFNGKSLHLKLELMMNKFFAFGINLPDVLTFVIPIAAITVLAAYCFILFRKDDLRSGAALAIIAGAAISNLADRVFRRAVVDFFSIRIYNFEWPSFNFADAVISMGILYLIIVLLKRDKDAGATT